MLPKNRPPTHPGEILLEEFLVPMKKTQAEFAKHVGWTTARLSELIKGRRGVTEETALTLRDALGTTAEFWMNLQRNHDLWHAEKDHKIVPRLAG
jgi:addiction module HigA family antidote